MVNAVAEDVLERYNFSNTKYLFNSIIVSFSRKILVAQYLLNVGYAIKINKKSLNKKNIIKIRN
jgi:hypothetical protein